MGSAPLWAAGAVLALVILVLLKKPLALLWRLLLRSGAGLCALWLFNRAGALIGVTVGFNLISAMALGTLGAPGLGLLLLARWALR